MNEQILFSIIIPTYNRGDLIGKTIQSILNQSFKNFELLIVDDGSTDNTEEVVMRFNSSKILYYKKKNEERSVARNFGVKKAKGKYVTFLDSDDLLYNKHFSEAVKLITKENYPDVFHLNYEIQRQNGQCHNTRKAYKKGINEALYKGNVLSCAGVFLKKEIALANPFNEDPRIISSEDWELWLRIGSRYDFKYSMIVTSCLVEHPNRSVHTINNSKLISSIEALLEGLKNDSSFMAKSANKIPAINAHMNLHVAYKFLSSGNRFKALVYVVKALKIDFISIVSQRLFYGVIKNWLLR